jgi:general stress protein 26
MKIHPQQTDALRRLAQALDGQHVAMLTLRDADGSFSSRPMTPLEMDASGSLWFIASRRTLHPVLGDADDGVPASLSFVNRDKSDYVCVRGLARGVDDSQRKTELWSAAARPWFHGADDPDLLLLELRPDRADLWDGPDNAVTRLLAMSASIAAGKAVGLGSKHSLETPTPP